MQRLTSISLSFVFISLFLGLFGIGDAVSATNSYRQVELRYRNASSLQQSLLPLVSDDLAIVAEGNSLILKGPAGELNQLVGIIKTLDRPRKQLLVSIYRGIDPSSLEVADAGNRHQDQRWSTNSGKRNRVDTVVVEEGATLLISESELYSVPLETSETVAKTTESLNKQDSTNSKKQDSIKLHSRYERKDAFIVEKSLRLVAALVKDKKGKSKVSLKTTYVRPSPASHKAEEHQQVISLNAETSTVALVELNQWQLLSAHQQQSHRPNINSSSTKSSYVFSTQKKDQFDYKVWVKFVVQ